MSRSRARAVSAVTRTVAGRERSYPRYRGWLKAVSGSVHVSGRAGYVYVQRRDVGTSVQLEEVRMPDVNVPDIDGFPVIVGRNSIFRTEDTVLSRDMDVEVSWLYDYMVTSHSEQHEYGGFDTVYLYARAMIPLRVSAQDTPNTTVKINAGTYSTLTGNAYYTGTSAYQLSACIPDWGQRWCLLGINQETHELYTVAGDIISASANLTISNLPTIPHDMVTLAAVQMYRGQTTIVESNIFDLRVIAGGWAGTLEVRDDGVVIVDAATVLNFTGDGVTVTEFTTGHADIYIPGISLVTLSADAVTLPHLSGATYDSVEDWWNQIQSSGRISGGEITANGDGTFDVAAGTGFIKSVDDDISSTYHFDWPAVANLVPNDGERSWVYVDYNAGVPTVNVTNTQAVVDRNTKFVIAELWRDGNNVYFMEEGQNIYNFSMRARRNLVEMFGFVRGSGCIISESGADRTVDMTAGFIYRGLDEIAMPHFDTDPGGLADTFTAIYRDGLGGWTVVPGESVVSNTQYDDGTGVLANLVGNNYGVFWVYLGFDNQLYIQYGQDSYSLAEAQSAAVPATMPRLNEFALLIARINIQRNAAHFYGVTMPWDVLFPTAEASDHGNLGGLLDNDHTFYASIRYPTVLSGGVSTEYADIDDAFAAMGANDKLLVPPGIWEMTASIALPNDCHVCGMGVVNTECFIYSTTDVGQILIDLTTNCSLYNVEVHYIISNAAARYTTRMAAYAVIDHCEIECANSGNGDAVAVYANGGTIRNTSDCYARTDGSGNAYGIYADGSTDILYSTARARGVDAGAGDVIAIATAAIDAQIHWSQGFAWGSYGTRYGLQVINGTAHSSHSWYDGDTQDIRVEAAGTLHVYAERYDTLSNAGTLTQDGGDRAGLARDETVTGAWTFNDDITVAAGKTVDGVDVGDHSARHDVGGADALTTTQGDVASEIVATDANKGIRPARLGVGVAVPGADGDGQLAGNVILSGAAKAVKGTGSVYPTLGTTTEAEKFGHAYLALTKEIFPDGETNASAGVWRRFVNKAGLAAYTHHRGTGTGIPAGCTLTATPTTLWAAWLANYYGWFLGTYYAHYPNHATLPAGLTVHSADPIANDKNLYARVHTTGSSNFGIWVDNYDVDRNYAIGEYIYRYDVYLYGSGPETLIYTQTATSICTVGGIGAAATFAAWVNHAVSGPYGPFCVCGDGIVLRLLINDSGTAECKPFVMGEQGALSGLGATQILYDDAWPGTSPYLARRAGTFHRGQGYAWAAWDWYWLD